MALVTKTFSDIITFTRTGTSATYFNSAGVLTTAGANVPRFDFNPATLAAQGLLIEEQRTNLLTYSEDFATTWTTSNSSITANSTTAPSALTTADTLVENTANAEHYVQQQYTVGTNAAFSFSVFVKAAGRTVVRLFALGDRFGSVAQAFVFDLSAITATSNNGTSTGTITSVGNGWFRCVMNMPTTTTTGVLTLRILPQSGANSSYTGDGTSGLFLWGAQLEAGAFPTSYIPTTTTALTRSADVASVNTLAPWFNSTEGTLFAEYIPEGIRTSYAAVFDDATANNFIAVAFSSGNKFLRIDQLGSTQASLSFSTAVVNTVAKGAIAYATNNVAGTYDAAAVLTDASATIPTVTVLRLGTLAASAAFQFNGWIQRITYYPRRLSNAELVSITT